jgi:hypothetical protein
VIQEVGTDERIARHPKLQPHQNRFKPANDQEHDAQQDVKDADPFVVDRRDPTEEPIRLGGVSRLCDMFDDSHRIGPYRAMDLTQAKKIRQNRVAIFFIEAERRHQATHLHGLRVINPLG